MEVICINNIRVDDEHVMKLTIGKKYHVIYDSGYFYNIVNDVGYGGYYLHEYFKTIEEIRLEKLNEIYGL